MVSKCVVVLPSEIDGTSSANARSGLYVMVFSSFAVKFQTKEVPCVALGADGRMAGLSEAIGTPSSHSKL